MEHTPQAVLPVRAAGAAEPRAFRTTLTFPRALRDARLRSLTPLLSTEELRERASRDEALRQEGARRERATLATMLEALGRATARIEERTLALEETVKPQAVALVRLISAEILRREIDAGRYDLDRIVKESLKLARGAERGVVARLNPRDHETWLGADGPKGVDKFPIEWKADAGVELGSCRIETPYGDVARDISVVVADVMAALEGKR